MLTEDDKKEIELIVEQKGGGCGSVLLVLFVLFLLGCFKGCGY